MAVEDADSDVGTYISMPLVGDGSAYHVVPDHWDELDGAYHNWVERRIDRVLELTCAEGSRLLVAASQIQALYLSTPESRRRHSEREAALKAEDGFSE